jgi:hypothetical protein
VHVKSNIWAWLLGLALIASAIVIAMGRKKGPDGLQGTQFQTGTQGNTPGTQVKLAIEPKNGPMVLNFTGDLADGGTKMNDGTVIPFVIGDRVTLQAEAINAVEYRWAVNGAVIKDKEEEWSRRKDREYEVVDAGELKFTVQVRGTEKNVISHPKEAVLKTECVHIISFEHSLVQEDDRALTGEDYTVEVSLAEPITADLDFYELRYSVNDVPVKHPDDNKEWTTERDFTYTFPAPGQYSFKVEIRRAGQKLAEGHAELAETVVVADAIVLSFDAYPEKYAALGTTIALDTFPQSIFGSTECRFGVKKVVAADFEWVAQDDGSSWGAAERNWLPTEPGNYIIRCEIREVGKGQAEDFRELLYTVIEGNF